MHVQLSHFVRNGWTGVRLNKTHQWIMDRDEVNGGNSIVPPVALRVIGLANDILFIVGKFFFNLFHPREYSEEIVENGGGEKALVVLLHGLNSNSAHMGISRRALEHRFGQSLAYFQPRIYRRGNCKLDEATEKVTQMVRQWAMKNPDKPIVFTGVSNGARISALAASQLKCLDGLSNPMKVHAAAGPFFGTHTVRPPLPSRIVKVWQWMLRTPLFKKISKEFIEEMTWGGSQCRHLINEMKSGARAGVEFSFYSSRGDTMVRSAVSAFPKEVQGASYRMFTYQGHSSIIKAVTPYVVKSVASAVG